MVMALGEVGHPVRPGPTAGATGRSSPVEVTASPKDGPDGQSTARSWSFRDITERTVLDEMKQQFISSVSHELRTPLTAIRGSLEMLADGDTGELPATAQHVVEVAARGAERLTRLVNDIIDIERLEAGSFDVRPRRRTWPRWWSTRPTRCSSLAGERRVRLEIGSADGSALCDADRIVQALVNLIGNAVKFTQPGGTVRVSARSAEHEILRHRPRRGTRHPGRGARERSSSVSTRCITSDGRRLGGTGLGLPITKAIVERHGGRIWVESEFGVGLHVLLHVAGDRRTRTRCRPARSG